MNTSVWCRYEDWTQGLAHPVQNAVPRSCTLSTNSRALMWRSLSVSLLVSVSPFHVNFFQIFDQTLFTFNKGLGAGRTPMSYDCSILMSRVVFLGSHCWWFVQACSLGLPKSPEGETFRVYPRRECTGTTSPVVGERLQSENSVCFRRGMPALMLWNQR